MCGSQVWLMLKKNLLTARRSKLKLAFELIIPLLLIIPIGIVVDHITDLQSEKVVEVSFDSFRVTGDWRDLKRRVGELSTIDKNYCMFDKLIGLASRLNKVDHKILAYFADEIEKRYNSSHSGSFNISVKIFENVESLAEALDQDAQGQLCGKFMAGIEFIEVDLRRYRLSYKIRLRDPFESSLSQSHWYTGSDVWINNDPYATTNDYNSVPFYPNYWSTGFISLQFGVDSIFFNAINVTRPNDGFNFRIERMPQPAYYPKNIVAFLEFFLLFWIILMYIPVSISVTNITAEKECGMMAYLILMGLSSPVFYISHFIFTLVKVFLILLPCCFIIWRGFVTVSASLFLLATLLYGIGVVSFIVLLTTVFHSSYKASRGASLIWGALHVATYYQVPSPNDLFLSIIYSLNINGAFAKCLWTIKDHMNREIYLGWANCFDGSNSMFTFGWSMIMLLVNILWMNILAFYFSTINPPDDIPAKNPLFFLNFLRSFCGKKSTANYPLDCYDETDDASENVQPDSRNIDSADIDIRHLTKHYSKLKAVDSLSFRAHPDNITVLLGHNGAGKTTVFSILAGILKPTSGSVRICGVELGPYTLTECQLRMGFCPQYNPIFELLTVREHLEFFQKLKGTSVDSVNNLIEELELTDKANEIAKNLSGGMKRKLCVGMALVGDTRIVILDEPTAGMDTAARYKVAKLLTRYKKERTILLTTHYMDEADAIGDRILIMVKGGLICAGTSDFLKSRFGAGYILSIDLSKNWIPNHREAIMNAISSFVENVSVQMSSTHQLTVLLPSESKTNFVRLFHHLELNSDALGIASFGLSLNTLEQVFLTVGEMADPKAENDEIQANVSSKLAERMEKQECIGLYFNQLFALLQKRLISYRRKWSRTLTIFCFPLLLVVFLTVLSRRPTVRAHELQISPKTLESTLVFLQFDESSSRLKDITRVLKNDGFVLSTVKADANLSKIILERPKIFPAISFSFSNVLINSKDELNALFNGNLRHGAPLAVLLLDLVELSLVNGSISLNFEPYGVNSEQIIVDTSFSLIYSFFVLVFLTCGLPMFLVDERSSNFMHQQLLTGLSTFLYWFSVYLSDFLSYSFVCSILIVFISIFGWLEKSKLLLTVLWILFFWSISAFNYCASLLFSHPSKLFAFLLMSTVLGYIIRSILTVLQTFVFRENFPPILSTACSIAFPSLSFLNGLYILNDTSTTSTQGIFKIFIYLFISGLLYISILFMSQSRHISSYIISLWNRIYCREATVNGRIEDVDVIAEHNRLISTDRSNLVLYVNELNKFYGKVHAVKDLSFGITKEECFGLLGANGAGKTSTFDVIAGYSFRSSGTVLIDGVSVDSKEVIGHCPQFDALLEDLTGKETLVLIASLRGFRDVKSRVSNILEAISLVKEANKYVKHYSGGQKRRLSIGVALICQAKLTLLDEPTAGVDPKARRQIWNLLSAMRGRGFAVLLTSHNMEECEALCTRIGIMHKGSLIAIGSPQHIKSKFGDGYTLTLFMKKKDSEKSKIMESVQNVFPNAKIKDFHHPMQLVWHIRKEADDRWSEIFTKASSLATSFDAISDFSIAQATLEEAFLRLSNLDGEYRENSNYSLNTLV